ncbi:hypothetical protein ISU69_04420 [Leptospira borgpetersenii serovar Hardjo-bovis]|nr:hypothetical protein B9T54_15750 [Leptospira borgpetersenii serovar Hardjo-bovis]TQE54542.1 hypothetical protein FFZ95_03560 [Leptospira borgpetersenii]AYR09675.1 hypothetical protein D1609_15880 [Leptospira borgpetersenii serovar Hardjo-bovis]MBE8369959.1 hypothetical protein [Leptospira borgpetersenii serovar Hardjo-bovis]MBF3318571.1 hypothetical protein [Leptospira borgpetersenii serovar Hardjo-bovis]
MTGRGNATPTEDNFERVAWQLEFPYTFFNRILYAKLTVKYFFAKNKIECGILLLEKVFSNFLRTCSQNLKRNQHNHFISL